MRRWWIILALFIFLVVIYRVQRYRHELETRSPNYFLNTTVEGLQDRIEIDFDSVGIPHVRTKVPGDYDWALGWLHAQDRWFVLDQLRHALHGETLNMNTGRVTTAASIACPFRQTVLEQAGHWMKKAPPFVQRRVRRYVTGFNAFLMWMKRSSHFIGRIPGTRFHPMKPWTENDVWQTLAWFWLRIQRGRYELTRGIETGMQIARVLPEQPLTAVPEIFLCDDPHVHAQAMIPWVIARWPGEKPGRGVPWVASLIWGPPRIPDPLYRVHWAYRKVYLAGDVIAGTPFWFAGRANFVSWVPYAIPVHSFFNQPDRVHTGNTRANDKTTESVSRDGTGNPGLINSLPGLIPDHDYPSALDWMNILRDSSDSPVNWWIQDFYGNRLVGPHSPCEDYIRYRQRQPKCAFEWPFEPSKTGATVCPGAGCDIADWPYPTWYEMILYHTALGESADWSQWSANFVKTKQSPHPERFAGHPLKAAFSEEALSPDQVDLGEVPAVLLPAFVVQHPGRTVRLELPLELAHPAMMPAQRQRLAYPLSGWVPVDVEGKTLIGDVRPPTRVVTRWLFFDMKDAHTLRGLNLSPNYVLGGKALGQELPILWRDGITYLFHTDPDRVEQVVVGRQILHPPSS